MQIDAVAMLTGREVREELFEGVTWSLYEQGRQTTGAQYLLAIAMLQIQSRIVGRFHETYDCWLTPTLGSPPIRIGSVDRNQRDLTLAMGPIVEYVPFTPLQNATGQPAISLPMHWSGDGLPVGVMFTARIGDEATLIRLAAQLEQAQPWIGRKPGVWG